MDGLADSAVRDRGTGVVGSVAGLLVAILFLALSAQVLLGLYATTVVRSTLHDAASRAADQRAASSPDALARISRHAEASLGQVGERTSITLEPVDVDGDGAPDIIVGEAISRPPRLVPASVGGMVGFEEVRAGVRVRLERPR